MDSSEASGNRANHDIEEHTNIGNDNCNVPPLVG